MLVCPTSPIIQQSSNPSRVLSHQSTNPQPLPKILTVRQLVEGPLPRRRRSLRGWFNAPQNKVFEARLKAWLEVFGCDPKVFTYSQPVRVLGAFRGGELQRLVWLRE